MIGVSDQVLVVRAPVDAAAMLADGSGELPPWRPFWVPSTVSCEHWSTVEATGRG